MMQFFYWMMTITELVVRYVPIALGVTIVIAILARILLR